jgi:multicomponent Na+:H+ antiporter subunit G
VIGELLTLVGAVLVLLSALGVVRFSEVLARLHSLAKASTLGILLLLSGAAINLATSTTSRPSCWPASCTCSRHPRPPT